MNITLLSPDAWLYYTLRILKKNKIVLDAQQIESLYKEYMFGYFNTLMTFADVNAAMQEDIDKEYQVDLETEKDNQDKFKSFFSNQPPKED